jgi:radical SAM protein with 4Fe4S-binding SPASM domain
MSNFAIDGHKLMYHPQRVSDWQRGKNIYPIYVEISLINKCNYRCCFCAFDYTEYSGKMLAENILCETIRQMADCGVKSIVFAGTGEPLLHPGLINFVAHAVDCGIDVGLSTNGALLTEGKMVSLVKDLSWIRISFNAFFSESYAKIHGCKEAQFEVVKENIARLIDLKKKNHASVTIGVQCLILDDNQDEFLPLAEMMKEYGVDYFSLKPYSPHPESLHAPSHLVNVSSEDTFKAIELLSDNCFSAIVRRQSLTALQNGVKPYEKCLGLPFLSYLEADGLLYACNTFVGDKSCAYGNVNDQSFVEIWNSVAKKRVIERLGCMAQKRCRQACRLDQINQYLLSIENPSPHVNFI